MASLRRIHDRDERDIRLPEDSTLARMFQEVAWRLQVAALALAMTGWCRGCDGSYLSQHAPSGQLSAALPDMECGSGRGKLSKVASLPLLAQTQWSLALVGQSWCFVSSPPGLVHHRATWHR